MSAEKNKAASGQRAAAWPTYLPVLVVTSCVLGTMGYALYQGNRIAASYTSEIDMTVMVRLNSALAHLRFEETLAGDFEGTSDSFETHMGEAKWCAGALLDGGVNREGRIWPVEDPALRTRAEELKASVSRFRTTLQQCGNSVSASSTYSEMRRRLHAGFRDVQQQAADTETVLRESMDKELAAFRMALTVFITGTVLVAAGMGVVLHRVHRRRTHDLRLIQSVNEELEREIHERCEAQELVRQKNGFLTSVIESLTHPFYVIDPDSFSVLLANSAARAQGVAEGGTCHELTHGSAEPCTGDECPCPVAIVRDFGTPAVTEHVHRDADGHDIHVEVHAFPITDRQGKLHQAIISVLDVTQRRQAEQRQTELTRKLEKVNGELREFAYVVSHDLKAPLRGIHTLADWIQTDFADHLPAEGKEHMGLLQSRVQRMQGLIDGILEYSRIGRVEEEHVTVDLNEKVAEIIDLLAVPDPIEIMVDDELPQLRANPVRIGQVFQNLLSNAVKCMDKPRGRVTVRCAARNGFWHFSVADNGPGIEEKYFEKIFGIFQTLAPKDSDESTGIGLTLVKKIVETWGGTVSVESTVGRGSTFTFTVPQEPGYVTDAEREPVAVG